MNDRKVKVDLHTEEERTRLAISGIIWILFASAAVASGDIPKAAAKSADRMMEEVRQRFNLDAFFPEEIG